MRFAKIFKKQRVGILDFIKRIPILRNRVPQKKSLVFRFLSNIRKRMESIRAMERRKRFAVLGISVIFLLVAGFAVAGVIGSFSTGDINKGLVGHWPLDSTHLNSTTNRVDDIGGYGNHGTNSGASLTTDRHGQANGAMSFDGLSNYINCGNGESLKPTTAITVELWTKVNSTKSLQFCIGYGNTGYSGWWVGLSNNIVTWNIGNGTAFRRKTFDLSPNQLAWHHIVGTYDNVSVKLYVDGDYKGSLGLAGPINYTGLTACRIGQTEGLHVDRYFNGTIDEVRIYDRALSEPEIEKLYETYKPKFSVGGANKGLVGHWSLRSTSEKVGSDLITNGDMEGGFTGGVADGWTSTRGTPVDETTDVHNGSHAQKINNPAGNTGVVNQIVAGTTGKVYKVTFWAKKYKGSGGHVYDAGASHYFTTIIVNQDVFTKYTRTFVHDGVDLNLAFYATTNAVGDTNGIIFDDVSIKEIKTADNTPNSNHGEIYGAEIRNHGASFVSSESDYVEMANTLNGKTEFTMVAWMKRSAAGAVVSLGETDGSDTRTEMLLYSNGNFYGEVGPIQSTYGTKAVANDTNWHHAVMVFNGSGATNSDRLKLYFDGEQLEGLTFSGTIATTANCSEPLIIGHRYTGYSSGSVSNVKIYDRALSASEILDFYQGKEVSGSILDMPLSDKTGFKDISGNDNHGTNYGADIIGEAVDFNGTSDYIDAGTATINAGKESTVSLWIRPMDVLSSRTQRIFSTGYTHGNGEFIMWVYSNKLGINYQTGGSNTRIYSNTVLSAGEWISGIATTDDSGNVKLYIDGVLQSDVDTITIADYTLYDLRFGAREGGAEYYDGSLSGVRVYDRALSQPEITALYAKGRSGSSVGTSTTNLNKGLVGQWDLKSKNEKVGGELVANGINWNDGNEDGLADGYSTLGVNAITTITTGSGFSGNIQKIEAGVTENTALIWDTSLEVGKVYRITAKVKTNNGGALHLVYGETATVSVPGDSAVHKIELTSQITQQYAGQIRFYVRSTAGDAQAGDWIEVDEFSVKELKTADSTPYGNHGTIYGATVGDDYTSFDGGDWVDFASTDFGIADKWTVSYWVNMNTTALQTWFSLLGGANSKIEIITNNTIREVFANLTDGTNTVTQIDTNNGVWNTGEWNHMVVSCSGGGTTTDVIKIYVNSVSQGLNLLANSTLVAMTNVNRQLNIGQQIGGGRNINGLMSNVKIYNRALSGAEVKLLYDKGR